MRELIQTQYFIYDDNNEQYLENLNVYKDLGVICSTQDLVFGSTNKKLRRHTKCLVSLKETSFTCHPTLLFCYTSP